MRKRDSELHAIFKRLYENNVLGLIPDKHYRTLSGEYTAAQKLYKAFEIQPAVSMEKMGDLKVMEKIAKAKAAGFQHGDYEGNELQLPAVFVLDHDLTITYAHYGKTAGEVPTPSELAELLQ